MGIRQGSILRPLLFNILISYSISQTDDPDMVIYADDNKPYVCFDCVDEINKSFQGIFEILLKWFEENQMKSNPDKCHLVMGVNENKLPTTTIEEITNSITKKNLGITFDRERKIETHINGLCKKTSQIRALVRDSSIYEFIK